MKSGGLERRYHGLPGNKLSKRPKAIFFLDTEAHIAHPDDKLQEHSFRLGVACFCTYEEGEGLSEVEWRDFTWEGDIWAWVCELSETWDKIVIVAHGLDYDFRLARATFYLPRLGWEPHSIIMGRSCTLFSFEQDEKEVLFLDNLNIWRASLAQIGEMVGLPKMEVDFDTVTDEVLFPYCRRDVEILVRLWHEWLVFLDEHDLGSFGITAAQQAQYAYRHRFMETNIAIHNNAAAAGLARKAYHGGRSECFFVGKLPPGKYYKLDVNGLYAAMMKWYSMPRRLVKVIQNITVEYLDYLLKDYLVIAEVALDARLPLYVKKVGGRNCYPTGSFLAVLCTPELQMAMMNGEIVGVGRVALYEGADLFSGFVTHFTDLKKSYCQDGDILRARMCKLIINSLQGKFGQVGYSQEVVGDANSLDEVWTHLYTDGETGATCQDICFGGKIIRQYRTGEAFNSLPCIPAHVSAYGRIYMWSLIEVAGRVHVFYMDTDSLIVDEVGYRNLTGMIDPFKLGYLKVEGVSEDVEIFAKKDYRFGDLRVLKGIKDDAVRLSPDLYEQWHFTTLKWGFQVGSLEGVTLYKVRKQMHYGWVSGEIGSDGWVRPPRLHINPQDLFGYLADPETDYIWVWEFDPRWIERVGRLEHLKERATYELALFAKPERAQPRPLALQPMGV